MHTCLLVRWKVTMADEVKQKPLNIIWRDEDGIFCNGMPIEEMMDEHRRFRSALEKIADPTKRHKEPDDYTEKCCMMNIANEALDGEHK